MQHVGNMLFIRFREYSDVIQEYDHNFFLFIRKGYVHIPLESCSCVYKSKQDLFILEHSLRCGEGCLLLSFQVHHDLVITWESIQSGDPIWTDYSMQDMVHFGKWVMVLQWNSVQVPEVNTYSYFPILLPNMDQIRHPSRESEGHNDFRLKQLLDLFFY